MWVSDCKMGDAVRDAPRNGAERSTSALAAFVGAFPTREHMYQRDADDHTVLLSTIEMALAVIRIADERGLTRTPAAELDIGCIDYYPLGRKDHDDFYVILGDSVCTLCCPELTFRNESYGNGSAEDVVATATRIVDTIEEEIANMQNETPR